jgi:hypothetical protein
MLLWRMLHGTAGALTVSRPMHTLSRFNLSPVSRRIRVFSAIASVVLISVTSSTLIAQNTGGEDAKRRRGSSTDENGRKGFNPEDMQARMMSSLRERLEVPDDEEWKLISERLSKVMELRRATGGGLGGMVGFSGRGQPPSGDSNRGSRGTRTAGSPELAALQTAIRDKLPDAEIKSRLDRVRESRKDNEAKLSKAQEELRAVLSVRQEAVAVVFGMLP